MIQTEHCKLTLQALKGKLLAAYEYLMEEQDQQNADKIKQLASKLIHKEFAIAFCGHFSAGKSRMINRLIGENLLPSSPIPTSANLVKVKSGESYAKVFFKNGKPRLYPAPYDYEMVKRYCKDGDQIQEIELSHANSKLPDQVVVLDTPGIDSADDAHRIATESAIHLADLIFYVMDYNHVQSELNFMFTKELTEAGKEVYLVINQIDKHSNQELSFDTFKTSVVQAFSSWGVKPAEVFYTSLKIEDHEENQFLKLQSFLLERLQEKDTLLLESVFYSLQKILKDHLEIRKKTEEEKLIPVKVILSELSEQEQADLIHTYGELHEQDRQLHDVYENAKRNFEIEVNKIMENAYLMPFETRALAQAYLESCQPNFKVGLLFTKQKTLAAKQERLTVFYQAILKKTKSQLEWHLREFLLRFLRERRIEDKILLEKVQNFSIQFSEQLLVEALKAEAHMSGEYVLNYTADVANGIKRIAKQIITALKTEMLHLLEKKNTKMQESSAKKIEAMDRYITAVKKVEAHKAAIETEEKRLAILLQENNMPGKDRFDLFVLKETEYEVIREAHSYHTKAEENVKVIDKPLHLQEKKTALSAESGDQMKRMAQKLKQASQLVHDLPGFHKLAAELAEKAERLDQQGFTVALFGAFSAGKSSFANALIGESVLPVSPNPMTAAINKIKPVDAIHQHGEVIVKLKAASIMLADVNHALKAFDVQAPNLTAAKQQIEKLHENLQDLNAGEKRNYAFLQAFIRGYHVFVNQLGSVIQTTVDVFGEYVAMEEKSCFVESIDLYYDCALTRKGITLVDTPGADSINARHTGVAFDFIKNSDAILFVTYYNHAFSKADREFVIQLGRVKESFQLDKMFFMINAIDLAEHEEEKETVIAYVRGQLIEYGVRNPHLYPISSLAALQEKLKKETGANSGMSVFEEAFYHFITNDLANLASKSSEKELQRVCQLVEKLIEHTQEDVAVKQKKRMHIEAEKASIHAIFTQQSTQDLNRRLQQESEELIYYIKQRVFLRFNDFFKEAFNPAVLRDDGRDMKKVLQYALDELIAQIGFDFAQEMRATTVRLDRFAEKISVQYQTTLSDTLREINEDLSFSLFELQNHEKIEFEAAFKELPSGMFTKALSFFKNSKAFFEKNQSKGMRDELYNVLSVAADTYLQHEQERIQRLYEKNMENAFNNIILHMTAQTDDFYLSLFSALDGGISAEQLIEVRQNLKNIS
ncbi:dynamin family protein [Anaerosinus massiliensis]|uniref:dynamin family protein n=1 Tax=Massilibacillus massiliensis TaxID=1806837 RepID=UPI000AEFC0C4|nr:dynamin family protein [Massilibacillus massiliensis]